MTLTQSQIQKLDPTSKTYKKGCGYGLFIYVQKEYEGMDGDKRGGGKYFKGRYQDKEIQIGRFGRGRGEYDLESAFKKWIEIKEWSKNEGRGVNEYSRQIKIKKISLINHTFQEAVDGYLNEAEKNIGETCLREYRRMLSNITSNHIDGLTPLKSLEWSKGGRQFIEGVLEKISDGRKFDAERRYRTCLTSTFNYSISKGWMKRGENPAVRDSKTPNRHKSKSHPSIHWNDVPELINAINLNKCDSHIQWVLSTKLMLLTFLRAGALCRLEWEWIDEENKLLVIPGKTLGLKRVRGVNDDIPHHIPITNEIDSLLKKASAYNSGEKYIFLKIRDNQYPHLDPSAPNNYLRNLGYKGKQRAHGWRSVVRTVGEEELKFPEKIIRRQMGHLPEGKVEKAYNKTLLLDERREFMNKWNQLLVSTGLEI